MVDSGATGMFMDHNEACRLGLVLLPKAVPEDVYAVDGRRLVTGPIGQHTGVLPMRYGRNHLEQIDFNIIRAPQYGVILGLPWLQKHNPFVDWPTHRIEMTSPYCILHCGIRTESLDADESGSQTVATAAEKDVALPQAYHSFEDVFDEVKAEVLPPHRQFDCQIDLVPGASVPSGRLYALTEPENVHLRGYLDKLLKLGFIRPSKSPAASPLFFIPKANGELRACVDFRALNAITIKNRYPLPLISVLLEQVKKARIYTKLDLKGAYHLVRMRDGDEWKTAFKTRFGLFEYLVMPFGLCNAPAAFQYFLNEVFREELDIYVVVYIDDILIYSSSVEEHVHHVKAVLQKLRENMLFCKLSKCDFHVTSVEFLGVMLSPEGQEMAERKIKAVKEWPVPQSVKDVQSFIGFANFYRRFIDGFSGVVAPITQLLRKSKEFVWSPEANKAFEALKSAFGKAPVLAHPDPDLPYVVEADASDVALGAILSQRNHDTGVLHPVAYMSRKLNDAERNYHIAEKELLAIKDAFTEWRHWLMGARHVVSVYTDHRNLQFMTATRHLSPRQLRWMIFFAGFNFRITYRPGTENRKADALSRQSAVKEPLPATEHSIISPRMVLGVIQPDTFLRGIKRGIRSFAWRRWLLSHREWQLKDGIPLKGRCLLIPTPRLRKQAFIWCHDSPCAGHLGFEKTVASMGRHFWWPTMRVDVRRWGQECPTCATMKADHGRTQGLLHPLPTPDRPWDSISLDFVVGLPVDQGMTAILVVVDYLTKMGHFIPCKRVPTAGELASLLLKNVVRLHGLPGVIVSDRGSQFTAQFWKTWCTALHVKTALSTSYHPQTDGQTERLNQTLKQYLRCFVDQGREEWVDLLWVAEIAYNNATHSSTQSSPFYSNYGQHPRFLPFLHPFREDRIPATADRVAHIKDTLMRSRAVLIEAKRRYKAAADRKRRPGPLYRTGDYVWISTRNMRFRKNSVFHPKYMGPYRITKCMGPVNVKVCLPQSLRIHPVFHVSLLKPAPSKPSGTPRPVCVESEVEYEVSGIRASKWRRGKLWYLVAWKGYGPEEHSWEPAEGVHAPRLVSLFHRRFPASAGPVGSR